MSELSEAATRDRADTAFLVGCAHGRAMGAAEVIARVEVVPIDHWQTVLGPNGKRHGYIDIDVLRAALTTKETT